MATAVVDIVESRPHVEPSAFDFSKRFPGLDGLRGLAILLVYFHNYAGGLLRSQDAATHGGSATIWLITKVLGSIFGIGWIGVALFFVLSGFLITGILYDTRHDPSYYRKFYARRALRIFPVYYVFAAILVAIGYLVRANWHPGDLLFLVYLGFPAAFVWPAMIQVSSALHFTHLWSLCVEEQFYLLWPAPVRKLKDPNALLRLCAATIIVSVAFRTLVWAFGWSIGSWSYGFLLGRIDELAIGAALAILVRGPWKATIQHLAWPIFLLFAAFLAAICGLRHTVDSNDALISTVGYTVIGTLCGALLLLAMAPGSWVQRLFSLDSLRIVGKYSYGFYVYHAALAVALNPLRAQFVTVTRSVILGSGVYLTFCLGLNLAIAALSFHCFEAPIMRWKSQFAYPNASKKAFALAV